MQEPERHSIHSARAKINAAHFRLQIKTVCTFLDPSCCAVHVRLKLGCNGLFIFEPTCIFINNVVIISSIANPDNACVSLKHKKA